MRFSVPQFIDIEAKIIGPITPRQFIIVIIGGGLIFLCHRIFSFWSFLAITFIFLLPPIILFAFVKFNGRPFHYFILSMLQSIKRPGLRVWRKEEIKEKEFVPLEEKKVEGLGQVRKSLPSGRLSALSLQVDTGGRFEAEQE